MTRLDALLAGEVGTPVPGSDFALVLDALRAERAAHDVTASAAGAAARTADADLARLNADLDAAHLAAARVVAERDALRSERDAFEAPRRRVDGRTRIDVYRNGRTLSLDLAAHCRVADAAKDIDRALRDAADEEVSVVDALRAYDVAAKTGIPLVAHAHALRVAARAAGIRTGEFFDGDRSDWPGLIAACRKYASGVISVDVAPTGAIVGVVAAPDAGRSEASDGFGLGQVGGAA